jgi:hypothetical protein
LAITKSGSRQQKLVGDDRPWCDHRICHTQSQTDASREVVDYL